MRCWYCRADWFGACFCKELQAFIRAFARFRARAESTGGGVPRRVRKRDLHREARQNIERWQARRAQA